MVIFAPSNRVMVNAFFKNLPPKKSSILKKSRAKIPLVMGRPRIAPIFGPVFTKIECIFGPYRFQNFRQLLLQSYLIPPIMCFAYGMA